MDKQPASMRALMVEQAGAPFAEVRLPRPVAGPGEVLVRIVASDVNPLDTKIRAGQAAHARQPLPAILGMDLAGVVAGPPVLASRAFARATKFMAWPAELAACRARWPSMRPSMPTCLP